MLVFHRIFDLVSSDALFNHLNHQAQSYVLLIVCRSWLTVLEIQTVGSGEDLAIVVSKQVFQACFGMPLRPI